MYLLNLFLTLISVIAAPLESDSLITLRTTVTRPSAGGNTVLYKELVLEEWSSKSFEFVQSWHPNCTLPDIQTETLREGLLRSRYPYGDGIWFVCRNLPVNTSFTTQIAPLVIMNLQENGELIEYATDTTAYPGGTTTNLIVPYWDIPNDRNIFYILGGASASGTAGRVTLPRIRVDTGSGTFPETQGPLATYPTGTNPVGLSIMIDSLFMPAVVPNGTSLPYFVLYLVGEANSLPVATRNPVSFALFDIQQMLSSWTFPNTDILWYTGLNRLPYLARINFTEPDTTKNTLIFQRFPATSSGNLGGIPWRVNTARFEGDFVRTRETVYISNGSSVMKNTVLGLISGEGYQNVVNAPQGWRFMDIHARTVNLPTATPTATATTTSSASAPATATATTSSSSSASATATPTATTTSSASASATATATATTSSSSSASASATATTTSSPLPTTTTSSNGTDPIPANIPINKSLSPEEQVGISIGAVVTVLFAGVLLVKYTPSLRRLYIREFGSKTVKSSRPLPRIPKINKDLPITINHNPQILVHQRLEQLKQFNKQRMTKEPLETMRTNIGERRNKKEFHPVITGTSV